MYFNSFLKCSVVLFGVYQLASTATYRCYYTFSNHIDVSIDSPEALYNSSNPCMDLKKPTYIVAIGYNFLLEGPLLSALIPVLLSLGEWNVILVNWQKEASDANLPTALGYALNAVPNAQRVGVAVGNSMAKLVQNGGLNPNITFIGHSLGAHLVGFAGRQSSSKGFQLPVIIALDPARLLYEAPTLNKPVDKSSAKFVYAVHCDVGGYAINKTLAHVDFWPNFGNFNSSSSSRLQPGCPEPSTTEEKMAQGSRCSHDYCWRFFNISLNSPSLFEGGKADNYYDFLRKNGSFDVTNLIGPLVDPEKTGNFYFNTDDTYPWGRSEKGLYP